MSSHNETIIRCFKTTMNKYQPFGQLEFKFEENQCKYVHTDTCDQWSILCKRITIIIEINILFRRSIADLKRCIVPELEKCKQPTPANMVDALFELIRRKTPCSKYVPYRTWLINQTIWINFNLILLLFKYRYKITFQHTKQKNIFNFHTIGGFLASRTNLTDDD